MPNIRNSAKDDVYAMLNSFENHTHVNEIYIPIFPGLDYDMTLTIIKRFIKTRPINLIKLPEKQYDNQLIKVEKINKDLEI